MSNIYFKGKFFKTLPFILSLKFTNMNSDLFNFKFNYINVYSAIILNDLLSAIKSLSINGVSIINNTFGIKSVVNNVFINDSYLLSNKFFNGNIFDIQNNSKFFTAIKNCKEFKNINDYITFSKFVKNSYFDKYDLNVIKNEKISLGNFYDLKSIKEDKVSLGNFYDLKSIKEEKNSEIENFGFKLNRYNQFYAEILSNIYLVNRIMWKLGNKDNIVIGGGEDRKSITVLDEQIANRIINYTGIFDIFHILSFIDKNYDSKILNDILLSYWVNINSNLPFRDTVILKQNLMNENGGGELGSRISNLMGKYISEILFMNNESKNSNLFSDLFLNGLKDSNLYSDDFLNFKNEVLKIAEKMSSLQNIILNESKLLDKVSDISFINNILYGFEKELCEGYNLEIPQSITAKMYNYKYALLKYDYDVSVRVLDRLGINIDKIMSSNRLLNLQGIIIDKIILSNKLDRIGINIDKIISLDKLNRLGINLDKIILSNKLDRIGINIDKIISLNKLNRLGINLDKTALSNRLLNLQGVNLDKIVLSNRLLNLEGINLDRIILSNRLLNLQGVNLDKIVLSDKLLNLQGINIDKTILSNKLLNLQGINIEKYLLFDKFSGRFSNNVDKYLLFDKFSDRFSNNIDKYLLFDKFSDRLGINIDKYSLFNKFSNRLGGINNLIYNVLKEYKNSMYFFTDERNLDYIRLQNFSENYNKNMQNISPKGSYNKSWDIDYDNPLTSNKNINVDWGNFLNDMNKAVDPVTGDLLVNNIQYTGGGGEVNSNVETLNSNIVKIPAVYDSFPFPEKGSNYPVSVDGFHVLRDMTAFSIALWQAYYNKFVGMDARQALNYVLTDIYNWINKYAPNRDDYWEVFKLMRSYAEGIVDNYCPTTIHRYWKAHSESFDGTDSANYDLYNFRLTDLGNNLGNCLVSEPFSNPDDATVTYYTDVKDSDGGYVSFERAILTKFPVAPNPYLKLVWSSSGGMVQSMGGSGDDFNFPNGGQIVVDATLNLQTIPAVPPTTNTYTIHYNNFKATVTPSDYIYDPDDSNKTMMTLSSYANLLGKSYTWDGTNATIDGKGVTVKMINGNPYVYTRDTSEYFGYQVHWDSNTGNITIWKVSEPDEYPPGFSGSVFKNSNGGYEVKLFHTFGNNAKVKFTRSLDGVSSSTINTPSTSDSVINDVSGDFTSQGDNWVTPEMYTDSKELYFYTPSNNNGTSTISFPINIQNILVTPPPISGYEWQNVTSQRNYSGGWEWSEPYVESDISHNTPDYYWKYVSSDEDFDGYGYNLNQLKSEVSVSPYTDWKPYYYNLNFHHSTQLVFSERYPMTGLSTTEKSVFFEPYCGNYYFCNPTDTYVYYKVIGMWVWVKSYTSSKQVAYNGDMKCIHFTLQNTGHANIHIHREGAVGTRTNRAYYYIDGKLYSKTAYGNTDFIFTTPDLPPGDHSFCYQVMAIGGVSDGMKMTAYLDSIWEKVPIYAGSATYAPAGTVDVFVDGVLSESFSGAGTHNFSKTLNSGSHGITVRVNPNSCYSSGGGVTIPKSGISYTQYSTPTQSVPDAILDFSINSNPVESLSGNVPVSDSDEYNVPSGDGTLKWDFTNYADNQDFSLDNVTVQEETGGSPAVYPTGYLSVSGIGNTYNDYGGGDKHDVYNFGSGYYNNIKAEIKLDGVTPSTGEITNFKVYKWIVPDPPPSLPSDGTLGFYVDGNLITSWTGETPFDTYSYRLPYGNHILVWKYTKGASNNPEENAFVRNLVIDNTDFDHYTWDSSCKMYSGNPAIEDLIKKLIGYYKDNFRDTIIPSNKLGDVGFTKTSDRQKVRIGDTVTYTYTVSNNTDNTFYVNSIYDDKLGDIVDTSYTLVSTEYPIATIYPPQYEIVEVNNQDKAIMPAPDLANLLGKSYTEQNDSVIIGGTSFTPYCIKNGIPYVFVRDVSEILGFIVDWDGSYTEIPVKTYVVSFYPPQYILLPDGRTIRNGFDLAHDMSLSYSEQGGNIYIGGVQAVLYTPKPGWVYIRATLEQLGYEVEWGDPAVNIYKNSTKLVGNQSIQISKKSIQKVPNNPNQTLSPGQTGSFQKTVVINNTTDTSIINNATLNNEKTVSHTINVVTDNLIVEKFVDKSEVSYGENVTYTFKVRNAGTDVLTNISVVDDKLGNIDLIPTLNPNEQKIYTRTVSITKDTHNIVTVTGYDSSGKQVQDTAEADVKLKLSKLIKKYVWILT